MPYRSTSCGRSPDRATAGAATSCGRFPDRATAGAATSCGRFPDRATAPNAGKRPAFLAEPPRARSGDRPELPAGPAGSQFQLWPLSGTGKHLVPMARSWRTNHAATQMPVYSKPTQSHRRAAAGAAARNRKEKPYAQVESLPGAPPPHPAPSLPDFPAARRAARGCPARRGAGHRLPGRRTIRSRRTTFTARFCRPK